MPVTDPISDMLTRIRNATMVGHPQVKIPHSKMKDSLLQLLQREGFIAGFETATNGPATEFTVNLRYYDDTAEPVITGLKRVSKPGRRIYVGKHEMPRYLGGRGVAFMSTPAGVMTGSDARRAGVGGELLFYVW